MTAVVYILTNEAMPGLVKIGITTGDVTERIKQLDGTAVPLPFRCFYAAEVPNAKAAERAIHKAFDDYRVSPGREFFRLSPDKPKIILELLCTRDVTPGVELFTKPGDKEALGEATKRRAVFNFKTVGLTPGIVLQSVFDQNITCTIKGERRVDFRGKETSLSSAALEIAHEKGYSWSTIAGPDYWKYSGKTLSELRQEKLEEE